MRARRGAFGMVVVELAPIAQPHVLLPQPSVIELANKGIAHWWSEDNFVPRMELSNVTLFPVVRARDLKAKDVKTEDVELTPEELRKMKEYEAAREAQPWGWAGAGLFGPGSRVFMSVTGPRWRCCGNRFEDEHSPWCSIEGFSDPFPESM